MSGLAFLFPGQGSQFAGMGKDLAERFAEAREVYARADAALAPLGLVVSKVSFEGTEEDLRQTAVTQPAILTHAVAVLAVLKAKGIVPAAAAGHSLGEYAALVAAGALTLEDAVVLVRRRGTFMQEAVPA
ncbi:MAG: ACP S-malonyltransferase, partial [Thermoanaerobaculia bacterium]